MAKASPSRVAVAVSKYRIGNIVWDHNDPVVLTGGSQEDHVVLVYRRLGIQGDDWLPLSRERLELGLNTNLAKREDNRDWKVEDVDLFIIFLATEALLGLDTVSRIAPVENALLWQLPVSRIIYLTSTKIEVARAWLQTINHEYATLMRVYDSYGEATMMRLVELFIRDGVIQTR